MLREEEQFLFKIVERLGKEFVIAKISEVESWDPGHPRTPLKERRALALFAHRVALKEAIYKQRGKYPPLAWAVHDLKKNLSKKDAYQMLRAGRRYLSEFPDIVSKEV